MREVYTSAREDGPDGGRSRATGQWLGRAGLLAVVAFSIEFSIMSVLPMFHLEGLWESTLDSFLLAVLILPAIHLLVPTPTRIKSSAAVTESGNSRLEKQMWGVLSGLLGLIVIVAIGYGELSSSRDTQARRINVAALQLLLVHHISNSAVLDGLDGKVARTEGRASLDELLVEFRRNLHGLRYGDDELGLQACSSDGVIKQLAAVEEDWLDLEKVLHESQAGGEEAKRSLIVTKEIINRVTQLTADMAQAVTQMENEVRTQNQSQDAILGAGAGASTILAILLAILVRAVMRRRQLLESAQQRSEAMSRAIVDHADEAIITFDEAGRIQSFNKKAEEAFVCNEEDVLGENVYAFIPENGGLEHDGDVDLHRETKFKRIIGTSGEITAHRIDGNPFVARLSVSEIEVDGLRLFIGLVRDLTEENLLLAQLTQAQKLESVGQLAAGIAHEINTPTQYIGDNTHFLSESFSELTPLLQKAEELAEAVQTGPEASGLAEDWKAAYDKADIDYLVEEIPRAIEQSLGGLEHVRGIVKSMKEFSHPGGEDKTSVDINRSIENTITIATNEWKYVADVETDFAPDLPCVLCLPGPINQAILNIVVNAAHAIGDTMERCGRGKGKISISTQGGDDYVWIRIGDTGTGIPEKVRGKIFDPFYTTKDVGKGTGQGLSIAYRVVVEEHGGTLDFETEMGKGTTFCIGLPVSGERPTQSV